jgi:HK97 family phage prohead protease
MSNQTLEFKLLDVQSVAIKLAVVAGDGVNFSGYASVFNGVDSYGDTIAKGAFTDTLKNRQRSIKMRWNHYGSVIGKWLTIEEDDIGLRVVGELTPGHKTADDVAALLKHGAIDGISIGYYVRDYESNGAGRILKNIELVEISVVEEPADLMAKVTAVKNMLECATSLSDIEKLLRSRGGFSQTEATAIVASVKKLHHGDRDSEIKNLFSNFLRNHDNERHGETG